MSVEIFMVPMVTGGSLFKPNRAKYTDDPEVQRSGTVKYSRSDEAIVMIEASDKYLEFVGSQMDVVKMADVHNIDLPISAKQAHQMSDFLERRHAPGHMLQPGDTRRQALRKILGYFKFSHRIEGRSGKGMKFSAIDHGVNLDTKFTNMTDSFQDLLLGVALEFKCTHLSLGIKPEMSFRQILARLSEEFEREPVWIGGVAI